MKLDKKKKRNWLRNIINILTHEASHLCSQSIIAFTCMYKKTKKKSIPRFTRNDDGYVLAFTSQFILLVFLVSGLHNPNHCKLFLSDMLTRKTPFEVAIGGLELQNQSFSF